MIVFNKLNYIVICSATKLSTLLSELNIFLLGSHMYDYLLGSLDYNSLSVKDIVNNCGDIH
jgi:hypothetical protein